ncbi:NMDA receptor-regulated protein 1-domain-containing protein [Glomus cerebriforme]|uniref:NMDA receptor-regulated protein 1-domain-containing protein n=1 Tax=Glomus cerebriforme TaxID=658196 RepID=A0A397SRI9_9GLOM|nr:NMDA receptor-regulated protein 1-domain-containing protein [Glomus cerebriforme]
MRELPSKESALFKQILKYYEYKQYKKGLKAAEQILKKFPEHGETLAMKGLFLNHMDRKEEAHEFVRKGLRSDLASHICWHVYGLLHRSDKNYGEALKCYTQALKYDKDNMQILQDYSLLQIQMRNYEAFNESRLRLLKLRHNNQRYWIGLAISYHLLENYESAEKVLKAYVDTLKEKPGPMNFEHSEMLLYHNLIIEESGKFEKALEHLESIKDDVCDRRSWKEKRAFFLLKLERYQEAEEAYGDLIADNPDCYDYYNGLLSASKINTEINTSELSSEQREKILGIWQTLTTKYPKSNLLKRLPLQYTTDERFKEEVDKYMQAALRKGVPSLFVNLKKLYVDPIKEIIVEKLVEEYLQNLKTHNTFTKSSNIDDEIEQPTAYLWTLYLLAQHYDNKRDIMKALKLIDEAIEHTPTLVELYMTKGRILKHGGNFNEAMKVMDEARELDLQDRFINSKCTKYMLRNDQPKEALKTIGLFTRGDAPDPLTDLIDMQCMWYALEEGECYRRQNNFGKALKRFHQIEKHFADITDDQFDFHTYCLRKVTLRAYLGMLRLEDQLRSHPYYFRAAQNAIEIYLYLKDNPKTVNGEESQNYDNMTEEEIKAAKKAKSKAKKAALKEAKKAPPTKEDQSKKKVQDDDPEGEKFLKVEDPLREALKFLQPLQILASQRIETHLLGFEYYIRKKKYLLALRALKRAYNIDKENPVLHVNIIQFKLEVSRLEKEDNEKREPQRDSTEYQTIFRVVNTELPTILPDNTSLKEYTEEFLARNKGSISHLLASSNALLQINPEYKQEATNILMNSIKDEFSNTRTLKHCISVYEQLKNNLDSSKAEEFKNKCKEWFPISTYFTGLDRDKNDLKIE